MNDRPLTLVLRLAATQGTMLGRPFQFDTVMTLSRFPAWPRVAITAALVTLLASCGGDDPGPPAPEPLQPRLADLADCVKDARFLCGTLEVPLDHANPAGESLRLAVQLTRHAAAPRGVILLLSGGPGQPSLPMLASTIRELPPVAVEAYRWVALDTRGTGAGALDCPALQEAVGSSDVLPASSNDVVECAAILGEVRPFLATSDTVADLDWLRRALGVESWGLNGISYGTYVASSYAMTHPDRVSSLVLDSPVVHTHFDPLLLPSFQAVPQAIEGACEWIDCPDDILDILARAVAELEEPVLLFNAMVGLSVMAPGTPQVPAALIAFDAGDPEPLEGIIQVGLDISVDEDIRNFSAGLHVATVCQDFSMPWGDSTTPLNQRETALDAAVDAIGDAGFWPFNRQTARSIAVAHNCLDWPVVRAGTQPRTGLLPDVPTLILSGELDLATPPSEALRQLELAPGGRLALIEGVGHSVQGYEVGAANVANLLCGEPYPYPAPWDATFERC